MGVGDRYEIICHGCGAILRDATFAGMSVFLTQHTITCLGAMITFVNLTLLASEAAELASETELWLQTQ